MFIPSVSVDTSGSVQNLFEFWCECWCRHWCLVWMMQLKPMYSFQASTLASTWESTGTLNVKRSLLLKKSVYSCGPPHDRRWRRNSDILKTSKCTFWSTQKLVHLQLNNRHKCPAHSIIPDMMNIQNEKNQCNIYIWFARFPHRRRDIVINGIHCTDWMLTKFMVNGCKWK